MALGRSGYGYLALPRTSYWSSWLKSHNIWFRSVGGQPTGASEAETNQWDFLYFLWWNWFLFMTADSLWTNLTCKPRYHCILTFLFYFSFAQFMAEFDFTKSGTQVGPLDGLWRQLIYQWKIKDNLLVILKKRQGHSLRLQSAPPKSSSCSTHFWIHL